MTLNGKNTGNGTRLWTIPLTKTVERADLTDSNSAANQSVKGSGMTLVLVLLCIISAPLPFCYADAGSAIIEWLMPLEADAADLWNSTGLS